jgi:CTP synthase (UTP-ammonia lyase)
VIGVIGDYDPNNQSHVATSRALSQLPEATPFEWIDTDRLSGEPERLEALGGFFIAPASPYRDMEAVLGVIRRAREQGVPLVGT